MAYGQINVDKMVSSDNVTSGGLYGFKNRIINGAMAIDQRNAGAAVSAATLANYGYLVDRFVFSASQSAKFSAQQNQGSVTPPSGFSNYLGLTVASAYSIGASDYFSLQHIIEGLNVADLGWGTASAQSVTLSFYVYSSLTGTFGGAIRNAVVDRSYPFTYTVGSANTWTQVNITVPGSTSGTWNKNNSAGITVLFSLGSGSTLSTTANAWASGNYTSATGATSVVGTNGATFYITGVQLEKGSTATSFDYRPYGTELALCQRYYWRSVGASGTPFADAYNDVGAYVCYAYDFPAQMRATPTINKNGTFTVVNCGQPSATGVNINGFTVLAQISATGRAYFLGANTTTYFDTSGAEL